MGYLLQTLNFVSVLMLQYLDNFLVVGYCSSNVRVGGGGAARLCSLLREEGAVISPKHILEPLP